MRTDQEIKKRIESVDQIRDHIRQQKTPTEKEDRALADMMLIRKTLNWCLGDKI